MSENESTDDFFSDEGPSGPKPSAVLKAVGDKVVGEVIDTFKRDKIKFGTKDEVEKDRDGNPIKQLVVVLQTAHRNWENVVKVPLKDREDKSKGTLDPSEDTGLRTVYIAQYTNLKAVTGDAVAASNRETGNKGGIKKGATFGVRVVSLEPTDFGNPKKVHQVKYVAPSAAQNDEFFEGSQAPAAPAQEAPKSTPAPAQDPWGSNESEDPPF